MPLTRPGFLNLFGDCARKPSLIAAHSRSLPGRRVLLATDASHRDVPVATVHSPGALRLAATVFRDAPPRRIAICRATVPKLTRPGDRPDSGDQKTVASLNCTLFGVHRRSQTLFRGCTGRAEARKSRRLAAIGVCKEANGSRAGVIVAPSVWLVDTARRSASEASRPSGEHMIGS